VRIPVFRVFWFSGQVIKFIIWPFFVLEVFLSLRRLLGKWSVAWVDLSGFEVCEDLVDRLVFCDNGDDLHLGVAMGAGERDT